ncbi:hypothetical protein VTK73DRAFT_8705 [Phialemonium thermophilum]|uniref:NDT80 domain-containing protein n=1 Tax=Phialemonium thermophilum TaxID=223376 RepID=A0ABR3W6P9_9PEZI
MRYNPDSTASNLTIEAPAQTTSFIDLGPQPQPPPVNPYSHPYSVAPHIYANLDVRHRLGSTTASSGMAHAPRSVALPHPGTAINTRDLYSQTTPAYSRAPDHHHPAHHPPRSPSFSNAIRRLPISPTPSSNPPFAPPRMDAYGQKPQQNMPPLDPIVRLGTLQYADPQATAIKFDINGSIDKGFFLADNEWTCYRRNYFSCICSFTLNPHYPGQQMQFTPSAEQTTYPVSGFAMNISAVVAESDTQTIDLVQHTPKRDKGPTAKPDKVRLQPKPAQPPQYAQLGHLGLYGQHDSGLPSSRPYDQAFPQGQGSIPTEHTFERIQFKQATANNGKRRAAQQYYHLMVELYADVSTSSNEQYVKIGYRKSAKMIVRGRSPGHYQSERRGSHGAGPSAGGPGLGDGYGHNVMGSGFGASSSLMTNTYAGGYDPRHGTSYTTRHHQEIPLEAHVPAEDNKNIFEAKGYHYYPGHIYDAEHELRSPVSVFPRPRAGSTSTVSSTTNALDPMSKVKAEYDTTSPPLFYPNSSFYGTRCGRFEGKTSSIGYYPMVVPPPSMLNLTS